jgi:long-chain acyl-CoA synthetase
VNSHDSPPVDVAAGALRAGLFEQLVVAASRATAGHIAIVDGEVHLTYPELLQAASEFCQSLAAAGVGAGDRVAVILGNRREFLVAAFGIWKCGAILTPLNPQLREAEVAACLRDTAARALVTTSRNQRMIQSLRSNQVPIDHTWIWLPDAARWTSEGSISRRAAAPVTVSTSSMDLDWPAVTQYSTGSTGRPKRVTRSHGQFLGEVAAVAALLSMTPQDRILGAAPFFHSYGLVVSALLTLLSAGTLYTVDTFLPTTAGALIERERLSGLPAVPSMFQLLAECKQARDLDSLRFCLSAGAPLVERTATSFASRYGKRVRRLYGSTETGVISISDDGPGTDEVSSLGAPIPGVSVEVLDETRRILIAGEDGLIRIRSEFAATCYDGDWAGGDSSFTDEGFIPGDEGRIGADGELVLRGRRRHFINAHGYKVDPSEVERVLLELPGVIEAVVLGIRDEMANERIKAVLIAPSGSSQQAVREHCLQRLAPFKCPQLIEFRAELPRNLLGKVLRKYLLDETPSVPPP